jgi:hypothetical protein
MPIKRPPIQDLSLFIFQTHDVEKVKVAPVEVQELIKQGTKHPKPNPYVVGHFEAINYIIKQGDTDDFPIKDSRLISSWYTSDEQLHWLRKIHSLMTFPIARNINPEWLEDTKKCAQHECGVYRDKRATLAFSYAPNHEDIPKILHVWFKQLIDIHERVKDNLDNPHGISQGDAKAMYEFTDQTGLLFPNLLAFGYGNNRLGRLVENLIRLKWHMRWKAAPSGVYDDYVRDIQRFHVEQMPKYIEAIKEFR